MDVDKLRTIIKEKGMFRKENTKNIICVCPYCGDHPNPRKKGHMYVSIKADYPVVHCFYCNKAFSLPKFIFDITADRSISELIISKDELSNAAEKQRRFKAPAKVKTNVYELPEIQEKSFQAKRQYIGKRSANRKKPEDFDNLIFDFNAFFEENNLMDKMVGQIGDFGVKSLQESFVGYITKNHSLVACRNINPRSEFKFRKLQLQKPRFGLLDYVEFKAGDPDSDLIVLAEGVFDCIGEMAANSLGLFDKARIFAAGLSYSYGSLLKSVCFDHQIYEAKVVILSDKDKHPGLYYKLRSSSQHVLDNVKVYYNDNEGGDFGSFPIKPFQLQLEPMRKKKNGTYRRKYR